MRKKEKSLSTMEHTVLGIVWQSGPCTTYNVMRMLRSSGSTYYRDRAGTTYPIVERLVSAKLLKYRKGVGTRQERSVEVTVQGTKKLKEWLNPPVPLAEVGLTRDLLRLRIYFMGALNTSQRKTFIESALKTLEEHLENCRPEPDSDPFSLLGDLGAVRETEARIAWLKEIAPKLLVLPKG